MQAQSNILGFDLLRDGLTRVHPAGYATLINAALDNGVANVNMALPALGSRKRPVVTAYRGGSMGAQSHQHRQLCRGSKKFESVSCWAVIRPFIRVAFLGDTDAENFFDN